MGFAKYLEDDMEIMTERQTAKELNALEPEILGIQKKYTYSPTKKASIMRYDIWIECRYCGCHFVFRAKDQEFYKSKGWPKPKTCKSCRATFKSIYKIASSF